ncbi:MAG: hypothetical protein KGL04_07285 [Elusimicrobia bacterium]|nr:hypothetical protein [Elusimicrobiota bacterium]
MNKGEKILTAAAAALLLPWAARSAMVEDFPGISPAEEVLSAAPELNLNDAGLGLSLSQGLSAATWLEVPVLNLQGADEPSISAAENPVDPDAGKLGADRWRWDVKTLSDPQADQVNMTPEDTTIGTLTSLSSPITSEKTAPSGRAPAELQVWKLNNVILVGARHEGDGDYHVILQDPESGATMIAEIPDPNGSGAQASPYASQLAAVRSQFDQAFGAPGAYPQPMLKLNVRANIWGVGFFDFVHSQDGVAPNGIELHPVMGFEVLGPANNAVRTSALKASARLKLQKLLKRLKGGADFDGSR